MCHDSRKGGRGILRTSPSRGAVRLLYPLTFSLEGLQKTTGLSEFSPSNCSLFFPLKKVFPLSSSSTSRRSCRGGRQNLPFPPDKTENIDSPLCSDTRIVNRWYPARSTAEPTGCRSVKIKKLLFLLQPGVLHPSRAPDYLSSTRAPTREFTFPSMGGIHPYKSTNLLLSNSSRLESSSL